MNQGVVHSSPVQQMVAAGSPNWWSINNTKPPPHHQHHPLPPHHHFPHPPLIGSSSSWDDSQDLPESWSQLLLGGLVGEEDKTSDMQARKLENWEEQFMNHQSYANSCGAGVIKQENCYDYGSTGNDLEFRGPKLPTSSWSHEMISASSPKSCVTTLSTNMLDFAHKSSSGKPIRHRPDPSSHECNSTSTGTGGAAKKARIQPTSAHSTTFKVRKEKLGDRVTALHQLVSPFGKTDTASVLLEAIGYIRFLQSQIEALSVPYLGTGSRNLTHQHPVQGERNSLFPEDPGQLLNKKFIKRKGLTISEQQESCDDQVQVPKKKLDLRSRGLCLVPISCTLHVGSDNGADYWAPGNYF